MGGPKTKKSKPSKLPKEGSVMTDCTFQSTEDNPTKRKRKPSGPASAASRASGRLTEKRLKELEGPQQLPAPVDQSAMAPLPKTAPGPASIPDSCLEPSSGSDPDSSSSEESPRARNPGPAQNQNKGPRASRGWKSSLFVPPSRCFKTSVPW